MDRIRVQSVFRPWLNEQPGYLCTGVSALMAWVTPFFVFFGWMSDKIGRLKIILAGCLIAAITYIPLFQVLSRAVNPDLVAFAQSLGSAGKVVSEPEELSDALRSTVAGGGSFLLDVRFDPDEVPAVRPRSLLITKAMGLPDPTPGPENMRMGRRTANGDWSHAPAATRDCRFKNCHSQADCGLRVTLAFA